MRQYVAPKFVQHILWAPIATKKKTRKLLTYHVEGQICNYHERGIDLI